MTSSEGDDVIRNSYDDVTKYLINIHDVHVKSTRFLTFSHLVDIMIPQ